MRCAVAEGLCGRDLKSLNLQDIIRSARLYPYGYWPPARVGQL